MMKKITPVFFLLGSYAATAQNITSPYSILGIGDLDTRDIGRYFISGSNGVSRRDPSTYNFSNPASLSSLTFKTLNMDVSFRGKVSSFLVPGEKTYSEQTKDYTIKRISLAFKPSEKTGIAFGLKPYSSVNYKFTTSTAILDGNTVVNKYIDGSGGINQVYMSAGRSLGKKFSAGLTGSFLFGSLQRNTTYLSTDVDLYMLREERDYYTGLLLQGGLQYSSSGKKWTHQFGVTGSISSGLKGQLTSTYTDADGLVDQTTDDNRSFHIPVMLSAGYSALYKNKIRLTAGAEYGFWNRYKLENANNAYTQPSYTLSAGMEFTLRSVNPAARTSAPYLGWGVRAEQAYLQIENHPLNDYSFTAGGGFSPFRNVVVYTGLEFGIRGDKNMDQIREKYTQFIFGINIKDLWIGTKKYGRYY